MVLLQLLCDMEPPSPDAAVPSLLTGLIRKGRFFEFGMMPLRDHLDAVHSLISSALEIDFAGDFEQEGWIQAGLPPLRMMAAPVRHFRSAICSAWQIAVAAELCKRKGLREKFGFDMFGSHQLLVSPHPGERDKMFLRPTLSGKPDGDGHLFGECKFSSRY